MSGGGKQASPHRGHVKVDACLFENTTITQNPTTPAAASFALPAIFDKFCAIDGAQLLINRILKVEQKLFNWCASGFITYRSRVCFLVVKPVEITDHAFGNRCGDFLANAAVPNSRSSSGLVINEVSTSTDGTDGDFSTTNAACSVLRLCSLCTGLIFQEYASRGVRLF